MSVDGEVLTDLSSKRILSLLPTQNDLLGTRRPAVVAMIISGARGNGKSTTLRSVLDAVKSGQYRNVSHCDRLEAFVATNVCDDAEGNAEAASCGGGDNDVVVVETEYYDLYRVSLSRLRLAVSSFRQKRPADVICLALDDIHTTNKMLIINGIESKLDSIVEICAGQHGGLLLTTCEDGDCGNIAATLATSQLRSIEYPLPRLSKEAIHRMHLDDAQRPEECEENHHRDVSLLALNVARSLQSFREKKKAMKAAIQGTTTVTSQCQGWDVRHPPLLVEAARIQQRYLQRDSGGEEEHNYFYLFRPDDSHHATLRAKSPLYGLEGIFSRLKMLCLVHHQQHTTDEGSNSEPVIPLGEVALKCSSTTGILLHGPSGCGKSALTKRLAEELGHIRFFFVSSNFLYSKYLGESEERLRHVFGEARACQPCVVVLDEIDTIAQSRRQASNADGNVGGSLDVTKRMLAALLCELDGVASTRGVMVIGTSNAPDTIDAALLRQGRLETIVYVPALSAESGALMTRDFLERFDHFFGSKSESRQEAVEEIAKEVSVRCSNCSPIGLQFLFRLVAEKALMGDKSRQRVPTIEEWREFVAECRVHLQPQYYSSRLLR